MPTDHRPYVIMQMSVSVDGRIAFAPGLTMFDKHPAEDLLHDAGPIWQKVTEAVRSEWHPQGTMMGSGTVISSMLRCGNCRAFREMLQAL